MSHLAEFRGPGVHHNYEDSDSGYEVDADKGKSFGVGGYKGRIIFLGDGTEVLTDSDDTEMFDNADEDKDLENQVSKTSTTEASAAKDSEAESSKTEATPADSTTSDSTKTEEPKKTEGEAEEQKQEGSAPNESKKD